ncbi:PqqD family protein [Desulfogranum japonicum]|uniref:PqqD family protein n=1 Tax=Desulfogranum japonicum TaxID=231447 RepID=UPI00040267CF|nr:PqqD family protein [Desulfogranum japonicum]
MFSFLKKSPSQDPLSRQEALACIPVQHPLIEEENNEQGLLIRYPVEQAPFFEKVLIRISGTHPERKYMMKKLQLDVLGSQVWRLIDGQRTVREIATVLHREHQLNPREAEIAVGSFLRELGRRSIIAMRQAKQNE